MDVWYGFTSSWHGTVASLGEWDLAPDGTNADQSVNDGTIVAGNNGGFARLNIEGNVTIVNGTAPASTNRNTFPSIIRLRNRFSDSKLAAELTIKSGASFDIVNTTVNNSSIAAAIYADAGTKINIEEGATVNLTSTIKAGTTTKANIFVNDINTLNILGSIKVPFIFKCFFFIPSVKCIIFISWICRFCY